MLSQYHQGAISGQYKQCHIVSDLVYWWSPFCPNLAPQSGGFSLNRTDILSLEQQWSEG